MVAALWILLGVIIIGAYNAYMLLDDKTQEYTSEDHRLERIWHKIGSVLFTYVAVTAWIVLGWKYIFFCFASFLLVFGGIVAIIGMKKSFFYVGTFAQTDKVFRKMFPKNTETWNAIVKIVIWILSIIIIFL